MATSRPRCGRIAYTNDLPIYAAFDARAVHFPGELVPDVPSALNRALLAGQLACSPISSFFYAQHPDQFVLLPRVCIGSQREVRSIFLISATPPEALAGHLILVTRESSTGRAVFETICRNNFGFVPALVDSDDPMALYRRGGSCLLIGDKAIDASLEAKKEHVYDLGELWSRLVGGPMVYAVWAARRDYARAEPDAVAKIADVLERARAWGERNLEKVIVLAQRMRPRPRGFYEEYYGALNFRFDEAAQAGLSCFFDVAAACGVLPKAPELEFVNEELARA
jgi:chorismate dehydratase